MRKRWRRPGLISGSVSGEALQRAGASGSERDSSASWTGAGAKGQVNTARGLAKSYGESLPGCNVRNMNGETGQIESGTATGTGAVAGDC